MLAAISNPISTVRVANLHYSLELFKRMCLMFHICDIHEKMLPFKRHLLSMGARLFTGPPYFSSLALSHMSLCGWDVLKLGLSLKPKDYRKLVCEWPQVWDRGKKVAWGRVGLPHLPPDWQSVSYEQGSLPPLSWLRSNEPTAVHMLASYLPVLWTQYT